MKPTIWFLLIGLCLSEAGKAQPESMSSNVKLAFNGSIIYPGFRAGVEYPVKIVALTKRSGAGRTKYRYLSGEIGYYHHPTFHDNIYLLAGWQMRRQYPRGFFTEFLPALGYSRTFLGGETYLVGEDGSIRLIKLAGYNYAMAAIGGGAGWRLQPKVSAYFRASLLTMFPSNNLVYIRPTVELGLIWQPLHFLKARPMNISKRRKS